MKNCWNCGDPLDEDSNDDTCHHCKQMMKEEDSE